MLKSPNLALLECTVRQYCENRKRLVVSQWNRLQVEHEQNGFGYTLTVSCVFALPILKSCCSQC